MSTLCAVLSVSRSGFYEWKNRIESAHTMWRQKVGDMSEAFFDASERTYGYRRIHADLLEAGVQIDDDTVRKIMRERGLTRRASVVRSVW